MVTLRHVTPSEHALAWSFIEQARAYQRAQGFVQWTESSPSADTVAEDITAQKAYFICDDGAPFGYVYIDFTGEPAYEALTEGAWQHACPYAAVHRVAFGADARGKGASRHLFACIKALCRERDIHVIRIDTHRDNQLMQHVLAREGFVYCGVVHYGTAERIAFELSF